MSNQQGQVKETFVLAADTNPAPEIIYLKAEPLVAPISAGQLDLVNNYQVNVVNLVTAMTIEIEALVPGGDPATAADWDLLEQETTAGIKAKREVVGRC